MRIDDKGIRVRFKYGFNVVEMPAVIYYISVRVIYCPRMWSKGEQKKRVKDQPRRFE